VNRRRFFAVLAGIAAAPLVAISGRLVVTGYAETYGFRYPNGDVIMPGAFRRTLATPQGYRPRPPAGGFIVPSEQAQRIATNIAKAGGDLSERLRSGRLTFEVY